MIIISTAESYNELIVFQRIPLLEVDETMAQIDGADFPILDLQPRIVRKGHAQLIIGHGAGRQGIVFRLQAMKRQPVN
ncbi:hypothetical protein D3C77_499250 [compost metagenome]